MSIASSGFNLRIKALEGSQKTSKNSHFYKKYLTSPVKSCEELLLKNATFGRVRAQNSALFIEK